MKLLIGAKQLQTYLQVQGYYNGQIDGIIGAKSKAAAVSFLRDAGIGIEGWTAERVFIAVTQLLFIDLDLSPGIADGRFGPNTDRALEEYQNLMRGVPSTENETAQQPTMWPTYAQMQRFYGPVGQNISQYTIPYKMVLAWDTGVTVTKISLHDKCAESALGCLEAARDEYGSSGLAELRLNLFGGSLNVRKMRGGSNWSVHSWAAAIDFDPEHNQFRWNNYKASLDDAPYDKWWAIWEAAGWVSLGRERNYDWMHCQAVRL